MKDGKKINRVGPILIAIAATLWALDGLLRRSLYTLPPLIIVFYEHLIGSILLLPILWRGRKKLQLTGKDTGILLFVALLSGLLGTLWFTSALLQVQFIPFSVVILLQKLQPLFAITAAHFLLKEKVTKEYIKWAVLGLIAAYFVTFPNGIINSTNGSLYAALLAIGAAFAWGTSTAFSRLLLIKNPAGPITALRFTYTTLIALVWIIISGKYLLLSAPTFDQVTRLFAIALSTGMVGLFIYYEGLKRTQAKISTIVELIFPMLAVFIDIFVYKSVLAPSQYIAAAVLIFAIYRVSLLNKQQ